MSVFHLLIREILHRKLNFLMGLIAITAAVTAFVTVMTLSGALEMESIALQKESEALEKETSRLMRDMGFNVLILPKGADMVSFWLEDFSAVDMPEDYVHTLANSGVITVRHLLAMLTERIAWRGRTVLLTGALEETPVKHRSPKPKMVDAIPHGKVWVGYQLAKRYDIEMGEEIEIEGRRFEVSKCLRETGSKQDGSLFAHLHDVQELLEKPGRINVIKALECKCKAPDRLATIRKEIAKILPGTQVTEFESIALARAETRNNVELHRDRIVSHRNMIDEYASLIVPFVLVVSGLWIGLLALGNVYQRRQEIGTLRAVGWGSGRLAGLFLSKAVLLGMLGAGLGYAIGTGIALRAGPDLSMLTAEKIQPLYGVLGLSLLGAPLLCVLATYLPAMVAVTQDPAVILVKE